MKSRPRPPTHRARGSPRNLGIILGISGRKLVLVLVAAAGLMVFAGLMMLMLMMAMLFVAGGRLGVPGVAGFKPGSAGTGFRRGFRARFEFVLVGSIVACVGGDRLARDGLGVAGGRAVARATPHAGAAVGLRFGVAVGAFFLVDQRLPVGDRDLVVIGVDFAEGQEAVAIAAIVDEGGLERRLDPGYLGEIDVAAELAAAGGLEIEFLDPVAAKHDHPGLLRMGRVDKHLVWHGCVS